MAQNNGKLRDKARRRGGKLVRLNPRQRERYKDLTPAERKLKRVDLTFARDMEKPDRQGRRGGEKFSALTSSRRVKRLQRRAKRQRARRDARA